MSSLNGTVDAVTQSTMRFPERTRTIKGHGGVGLAVQERGADPGAAPTVLLVHGYPDDHAVWDLVVDRLAEGHHVVTYDVRGSGLSGVPATRNGYRMEALVADLVTVTRSVSPDRAVHLVAHDWGSIQSWAALTEPDQAVTFASFVSMSGPGLDHAGAWMRARRRPGIVNLRQLGSQAMRSWYVGAFQTPLGPMAWRHGLARLWPALLERREGVQVDDRWPSPNLAADAERGVELYRANLRGGPRRARVTPTDVPVLLVVPTDDAFVTPALLDGIEAFATDLTRRDVPGGHWLPRSDPDLVAHLVADHMAEVEARSR